jgi:hypothetical protein
MLMVPSLKGIIQNLEPGHADVALVQARLPRDTSEMAEDRGALVLAVGFLSAELGGEEGVAAGGIDDEACLPDRGSPGAVLGMHQRGPARPEIHSFDAHPLVDPGALGGGVAEKDLVELGALHLIGVGPRFPHRIGEVHGARAAVLGGQQFRPVLADPDARDGVEDAQAFQHGHAVRQERFPDVEARVVVLLQDLDMPALFREQGRDGRARRPTADDGDIATVRFAISGRDRAPAIFYAHRIGFIGLSP